MGGVLLCRVTVTVTTALGVTVSAFVDVPETGTGLVDATVTLPAPVGDVTLVGLPCPTIEDITLTLLGNTVTINVTQVPAP
ncbi:MULTISPECIES: hypothetical protein [Priestia]|uniref:hypothetical protein n=1 Tax=Priestia TaxID=2800373 RepID=UPI000BEC48A3|nr:MULTISPECIES: hypothetical protein [Priestia]MBY0065199.1 hypothetical protein [Priestia aryabhattai]MEB4871374.1 hypothetical protein [Priestia megaterium]MED4298252.1 hypothetical protein [Priestia megaterium]PEC43115.1 hypothetical protein CON11_19695 [Priestia megaterium]